MSNQPINDADLLEIIRNEREKYEQAAEAERQALIEQRVRELLAEERAVERQENERAADILSAEYVVDPVRERDRARETAKSAALLLIMLLLILLLIAAATGRTDILPIPGVQSAQTLQPYFRTASVVFKPDSSGPDFPPGVTPEVDPAFQAAYERLGGVNGECSIGKPISPSFIKDGQLHQWFERALLHEMPSYITDPEWNPQGVLLGQEITVLMPTPFPTTPPFLSRPESYYFGETGYSVSGQFLSFWHDCDGIWLLGYPVSGVVNEVLTPGDKRSYQVQYFERGRLEYHDDDPQRPVQFGLLGTIKKQDRNFKPNIVTPQAAPVVQPATATPAPIPIATATPPPAATALPLPTSAATPVPAAPTAPVYPAP